MQLKKGGKMIYVYVAIALLWPIAVLWLWRSIMLIPGCIKDFFKAMARLAVPKKPATPLK